MGLPGVLGGTTHKLTLDDAEALERLPSVQKVVPLAFGQARVEGNGRGRSVFIYGVTSDVPEVWKFEVGQGSFLPPGDPRRGSAVAVLGPKLKRELFGEENALGEFVRIAGTRLRVIGVMAPKGRILGFDIDDAAYVPVTTAMQMFNLDELQEIDVLFAHEGLTQRVEAGIRACSPSGTAARRTSPSHPDRDARGLRQRDGRDHHRRRSHRRHLAAGRRHRHPHDDVDLGERARRGDRPDAGPRRDRARACSASSCWRR